MNTDSFDKDKTLDQENALQPKMVTVEIDGKPHQVPAGITLMKALWYFYVDSSPSNCRSYFRSVEDCS